MTRPSSDPGGSRSKCAPLPLLPTIAAATAEGAACRPWVAAHRSASTAGPENTLPAFQNVWEEGAVAGVSPEVQSASQETLHVPGVGVWFGDAWAGTRMPTFSQVLATVPPGKQVFVEVHCGPEVVARLLEVVSVSGLDRNPIVAISLEPEVIAAVEAAAPDLTAFWLSVLERGAGGKLEPSMAAALGVLKRIGADGIGVEAHEGLDAAHVEAVRKAGYGDHV